MDYKVGDLVIIPLDWLDDITYVVTHIEKDYIRIHPVDDRKRGFQLIKSTDMLKKVGILNALQRVIFNLEDV